MISRREVVRIALPAAIAIQSAWGASSALDFARFVQGPPAQAATTIGADKDGYIYAVGITAGPTNFPVTPGALNLPSGGGSSVFLQKFSPDGSQVLVSGLLGETAGNQVQGKVDSSGNVYVAFPLGYVAGSPKWLGDPNGRLAVLKIDSGGDKILSASLVDPNIFGPVTLALDSDGSIYVASADYSKAQVWKLDPTGNLTNYSYTFTDTSMPGGNTYDTQSIGLAVLPDHSLYVMASPSFLYRLDPTGASVLTRANVGGGNVQLWGLAADSSGNAYVSGRATSNYTVPSNQIGDAAAGAMTALIAKLDPSGSVVYSDLLPIDEITALAIDPTGSVWAGGTSTFGFTLFQLDASGAQFLHYFSLAAPASGFFTFDNQLSALSLDNQGRLLVAGSTTAIQFPSFNHWRDVSGSSDNPNQSAFFLRVSQKPPQTDLQLSVTVSPPTVTLYQTVTYQVQITNAGAVPANDVILSLPPFAVGSALEASDIVSCTASGQGNCDQLDSTWIITFPQISPGSSASVELQLFIPAQLISPLHFPMVVLSSTDDPAQSNNFAAADVVIERAAFSLSANISTPLVVDVAGVGQIPFGCFPGGFGCIDTLPGTADSPIRIYVPTPQFSYGMVYEFVAWSDGSTDNPRTFPAGMAPAGVVFRPVTEPWVDPDAGVVQAASERTGAVSPGEILTLKGVNLGPPALQTMQLDSQGHVATELGGFQVLFGNAAAPVIYTSATQSAVIVPYAVAGNQTVQMTMQYQQKVSTPVPLAVTAAAPGLFAANSLGTGILAALNSDNSINSRANPASKGDVVVLFATGEGLTNPTPADGQIAGLNPPMPQLPVSVSIGGQTGEVLSSSGITGFVAGLIQVKVRVPQSVQPGLLPVILTVGSYSSQMGATLAVK